MSVDPATPLVLVHGQLMTDAVWEPLLPLLVREPALIADVTIDDTIAGMAQRLLDAAPPRFALVGFAMGGFVALEVIRRSPERVLALALVATLAEADGPQQRARRQGYADLVEAGEFTRIAEERIPALLAPAHDPALEETVRTMAQSTGAEVFLRQQSAILAREDRTGLLPQIACPTLVIRGTEDRITNAEQFAVLTSNIPGARGETLAGCGHLVPLECPDRLAAALAKLLP